MSDRHPENTLVGRGNREGAELFRQWFAQLNRTATEGGPAAYVFVMGSMCEILRTFNLPVVFPEINSLQMAVRRVAHCCRFSSSCPKYCSWIGPIMYSP